MKMIARNIVILFLILFLSVIGLIYGCGSTKDAKNAGCPSGSNFAVATDTITGPTLNAFSGLVLSTDFVAVNGVPYIPEPTFIVTDENGVPRNNVCLVFTTNGFWWTDTTYTTTFSGSGINNTIIATTNDSGTVTLHWTTYALPLSAPAPDAATNGIDVTYPQALIGVSSGAVSQLVTANITVRGCPKELFGVCP